jgi:hypothetical protein
MTATVTEGHYAVLYVSGAAAALSNPEATTGSTYTWQITNAAKRVLDPTYAVTESKTQTYTRSKTPAAGQFTVNRLTGTITYGSSQSADVGVSGKYLPMSALLYAKDFTLNVKPKVVDTTALCSDVAPYQSKATTIRDINGTIGTFFTPDAAATFDPAITEYFMGSIMNNSTFALKFYMSANYELLAWVKVDTDAIKANVGNLMEETVSFSGLPDAEGRVLSQS